MTNNPKLEDEDAATKKDVAKKLSLEDLREAVSGNAAAFRCRRRLQPAGGEGDKVFPPTFAGAVYAVEQRRVRREESGPFETATCVLLDSVPSQANRIELALQEALDAGRIKIPVMEVDFTEHQPTGDVAADKSNGRLIEDVGKVTSLQVPHRLADAILRDSEFKGVAFRTSEKGKALNCASPANATPIFALCPTALVFGMWDSTGPKGGLGPKFERALVSEIVGVGAEVGDLLRGVRRDPLEIRAAVKVVKATDGSYSVADPSSANGAIPPSGVNHSSVPFPKVRDRKTDDNLYSGVTIDYAEQTTTLSLICLRRLRFPVDGKTDPKADLVARTVLAALGLCGAALAFEGGVGLRSRCLLWPSEPMEWELLARPGETPQKYSLTADEAVVLLKEAITSLDQTKLPWKTEPITLEPSTELLNLVRLSQLVAIGEGPDAN
jgi:CRISPR-associated protein Csb1